MESAHATGHTKRDETNTNSHVSIQFICVNLLKLYTYLVLDKARMLRNFVSYNFKKSDKSPNLLYRESNNAV